MGLLEIIAAAVVFRVAVWLWEAVTEAVEAAQWRAALRRRAAEADAAGDHATAKDCYALLHRDRIGAL